MKRFINAHKKALAAVATVAIVAGSGMGAYAYWLSSGTGTGSASTGTQGNVTLTQTSSITNLAPGAPAQNLSGTVTNSKGYNSYIGTVTPSIDVSVTGTVFQSGCDVGDYTFTNGVVNSDEASGATNVSFGSIQFNNDPAEDQTGCTGQALVLHFSSN